MKIQSNRTFPKRFLFHLIMFGFIGQIAWNVENMYFNTFLYNTVYSGASNAALQGSINVFDAVSKMVAYSAVTAVLTTFLMGTLSDKIGARRWFVCVGYLFWGVITGLFGFISRDHIVAVFHLGDEVQILTATVWTVILMDCLMTFVGSAANDAGFNAWVTDSTDRSNRASAESILSLLPLAATGVVLGLGGFLLSGDDKATNYYVFFIALGSSVALCGLIGLFTFKEAPSTKQSEGSYGANLIYGLRPSVIKNNRKLYLTLLAIAFYSIALQVFFPYLIIYLEHSPDRFLDLEHLRITPSFIAVAAVCVLILVGAVLFAGKLIDQYGKDKIVIPLLICLVGGLVILAHAHTLPWFLIGGIPTLAGNLLLGILLNAAIRDFTPEHKAGLFQGVRLIFVVLLPMVIGPVIGKKAILSAGATYLDEYGAMQTVPTADMFLYSGIVAAFALVPIAVILRKGGFVDNKE